MGDIQTHAAIASAVQAALPDGEDRDFVEVGNFLTDVSQFRDPYAHLGSKTRIWGIGRADHPEGFLFAALDLWADFDRYLDALMGVAGSGTRAGTEGDPTTWRPDDGDLAGWFRDVILVYGCERFHRTGIDKHEFLAVFERHFTQYYPHEHMDFPPWPHGSQLGGERPRLSEIELPDGSARRRLLAYLDDQLEYVADLLTRVEKEWATVAPTPENAARRRQLLADLGHASHALEDFFFHSNFVELGWNLAHPDDPPATRPLEPPSAEELESFGPPVSETQVQRRYHRRRRSPLANESDDALSTERSAEAESVYTGQFGGNDIFFTFVDAIGHTLTAADSGQPERPADTLRNGVRAALFGTPEEQAAALADHHRRLRSGAYVRAAETAAVAGDLERFEVDAVRRACERDLRLATEFSSVTDGETPLGIVGMLQKMLATARATARRSAEASAAIDADDAHALSDDRSDNGAPSEAIGSHTLMAKDSVRKEPLRVEAVNLATLAASHVARSMAAQTPPGSDGGVDWAHLLRAFVGHPAQADGADGTGWWRAGLTSAEPGDQLPFEPRRVSAEAFAERASEPRRRALERRYEELSAVVEAEYRSAVNGAFVLDATLTAGLVGGLSGLISGIAYGAGDGDAGRAAAAGSLGLIAGGAAGLLGSLLVTGIATAADESAGAVSGAVTSWAAAPVGAWFIGKAIADEL